MAPGNIIFGRTISSGQVSVQQSIIKGIKDLLFFNNYLVLPNFGGFVLKERPAHYSASGGLLLPALKTVSFNSQLKQNDGLLAIWLQKQLSCPADDALRHITEFAEFCSSLLITKRRLTLEGIGFFYLDFENNICFEPQTDVNFLTGSFGLSPVSLKPIQQPEKETKEKPVFIDRPAPVQQDPLPNVSTRKNYRRLVAPALLSAFILVFLTVLITSRKMNGPLYASFSSEEKASTYVPEAYAPLALKAPAETNRTYVADANGIATVKLGDTKVLAVKVLDLPSGNVSSRGYEIVLGCFSIHENAKRLVRKVSAKRIKAFVSGKNEKGMYVVSNGSFSTRKDAAAQLAEIKGISPNAWIRSGE